jgi:hypothetical protein
MSVDDSVVAWVKGLKQGDASAVQEIWECYFRRLVLVACRILQATPTGAADEEDVALSAFRSFYRRAREGQFPRLEDRDDLWRLLVTITARKAVRGKHVFRRRPR